MQYIFIIIAIIAIINSVASKKKRAEEAAKRAAAQRAGTTVPGQTTMTPGRSAAPARNARFPGEFEGTSAQKTASGEGTGSLTRQQSAWGSMDTRSQEGTGPLARQETSWGRFSASGEGKQSEYIPVITKPMRPHTVASSLGGGHSHMETSLTGREKCPPADKNKTEAPAMAGPGELRLNLKPEGVLQGILYSEILGRPKALRSR